jgi:hypothetical protein
MNKRSLRAIKTIIFQNRINLMNGTLGVDKVAEMYDSVDTDLEINYQEKVFGNLSQPEGKE